MSRSVSRPVANRRMGAAIVLAVGVAGCSADLGRFDFSSTAGGESARSGPLPSETVRRGAGLRDRNEGYPPQTGAIDPAPLGPPPPMRGEPQVRMPGPSEVAGSEPPRQPSRALPSASPRPPIGRQMPTAAGHPAPATLGSAPPAPPAAMAPTQAAAGEVIEVQQGDTIYGLAKRHRVSISELMTLNSLDKPAIRPGQRLTLPAGRRGISPRQPALARAAPTPTAGPVSRTPVPQSAPVATPPSGDWTGSHTIAQGESLYAIARRYAVKAADLQAANGITDPTKLRPGTVLKVPEGAGSATQPVAAQVPATPAPALATGLPTPPGTTTTARIINAAPSAAAPPAEPQRVASLPSTGRSDVTAAPAAPKAEPASAAPGDTPKLAGTGKFRWPVKGKVIAGFGPRPDSTHNDGINISVPQGTDVAAAEAGVVAYAGNELKGYGNLVLIRHENNWVSAYAHNESLLVKRGDKVRRGQVVAKAGNTGTVDQPQVHFELRQGSKPVDPMPHMERQ